MWAVINNENSSRGYEKGALKKRAIAEAVIDSLATNGIHKTTFEEIGKRTGMKRSHLVYYFKNHDEMILAAVQQMVVTGQRLTIEAIEKARTPEAKIFAVLEGAFTLIEDHPNYGSVFCLFYHLCTHHPTYKAVHTEVRKVGEERLIGLLPSLFPKKRLKRAKLSYLAKTAQAILTGYLIEWLTTDTYPNLKTARLQARKAFQELLILAKR